MTDFPRGSDLLIVDNSHERWKVADYLREWAALSQRLDIATGHVEIEGLLALRGAWQQVDTLRILMGEEVSLRTKRAFEEALARVTGALDESLEDEKLTNHFLTGVPAIVEGLRAGAIQCRVYRKDKFHAKAYITHARAEVVGAFALVGSSNLSRPGLTENIELNVQIAGPQVHALQEWYEQHWNGAEDVTPEILRTIERHVAEYTPFEVYAEALHEFFRGHEMTASEWEESRSRVFPRLDRYQKEAYWALLKIARQHRGAFLCDGVGLGKTFVGLMLIERLILHEGKRVALFAPKATKEGVWEPHLREWLPHIGGVGGGADFSNLAVFSHTDLGRGGDFPDRFRRIGELADAVVIDEAHHFRNPGTQGDPETGDGRSRYHRLYDILDGSIRPKTVFLLTATPINNRLADFRHMAELFTRREEAYFARTLGIHHFRAHFNNLEKSLQRQLGRDVPDVSEHLTEGQDLLAADRTFRELVVQRSRAYARESQMRERGAAATFPDRAPPQVADYSIRKTYGRLLDMFEQAFQRANPLFTLPIYYPLAWYKGDDTSIDPFEESQQKQVVGLIRTMFLKRFESSVCAFELSCDCLMRKLLAFLEVHSETEPEQKRLERWKLQHADVLGYASSRQLEMWGDGEDEEPEEDVVPQEFLDAVTRLDRHEYDVVEMIQETYLDLDHLIRFLDEARKFQPTHDDKLRKLLRLLNAKDLSGQKVLIFTEFADTGRYLYRQLVDAGVAGVAQVDSASPANRADVIRRFAPYYNGTSSAELAARGREEIRILISTDVLSEGLNLQDASRMINYDIHWNPVRLMQRIGRVDRRMNPGVERRLTLDHPQVTTSRGRVSFWNFLPPDELNALLTLYTRVTQKTLLISKTFGIEGKKLLTPEDDYEALREFNHVYEGTKTVVEDMHLKYQDLLTRDPGLLARLERLPGATFSGRTRPARGARGVFFCYALPALDAETGEFSEAAGTTRWYLADFDRDQILEEPQDILGSIRSKPDTPRECLTPTQTLSELRARVERHIKNTYLKRVDAPVGVRPSLKCWMELNEG
jgi:Helicase conserved C-terminal domain/PLD-like domain